MDTRGGAVNTNTGGNSTGSNLVYESLNTTNNVLTVTWDDVGYYSQHTNKLDAFQVQLISLGGGNFDIVFRYEAINWTTGDASGGSNGLGGSARPRRLFGREWQLKRLFRTTQIEQSVRDARLADHDRQYRDCRRFCLPGRIGERYGGSSCQRHNSVFRYGDG